MRYLELLIEANLVKAADQDGVTFYRFDSKNLELMARRHLSQPQNEIDLSSFDLPEDQQVFIHNFTRSEGSLKMNPTQSKKITAILEYTSWAFEFDAYYSEKEVNPFLIRFNDLARLSGGLWLAQTRKKWISLLAVRQ